MRCTKCNVDLGEDYTVCPLCGSKAENTEPLIPGQRTAEYPVLKPRKQRPDAFSVFLVLWAAVGAVSLVACLLGAFDKAVLGCIVMGAASVWAVVFRPVFVRQLYFGNYLSIAVLPLSVLAVFVERALGNGSGFAASVVVPCLFTAAILVMLVGAVLAKSSGKRAAPYGVLFIAAGIIGAVYCAAKGISCCAWLCETAAAALTAAVTLIIYRDKAAEELKAKFSI